MNNTCVIKSLAAVAALSAIAPPTLAAAPNGGSPVHFVLTGGLTAGGDTIDTLSYTNGDSAKIKGGGLVQLGAGLQIRPAGKPVSVLATLNYHVDNATADNGDARFDRMPVELLAFYHFNDKWSLGGGWRHTMNPKYKVSIDGDPDVSIKYKDANSLVVQLGFGSARAWGGLRYVKETFKPETTHYGNLLVPYTKESDGSHVGLLGYVAF